MSDLQIVLIVLGGFIIAGVVAYNWMQERKLRDHIREDFIVPKKDILVEEFYVDTDALVDKEFEGDARKSDIINKLHEDDSKKEPSLNQDALADAEADFSEPESTPAADVAEAAVESKEKVQVEAVEDIASVKESVTESALKVKKSVPEIEVHKDILPPEFHPIATSSLPDDVHSQIDLTAFLYPSKTMDGHALFSLMHSTLKDSNMFVTLHGLDDADQWHAIDASSAEGTTYKQVACSLQLADRRGPVPKPELNKFQFAIETVGLELNAHVEWQGKQDPAQRAIDLDKFCMDVDQLVSVHLMQGDAPIHGTKFKGLAETNGMTLTKGKFSYFDNTARGTPQFVLINVDNQQFTAEGLRNNIVLGATFQIEIPKVKNCEQAFGAMVAIAQKMANSIGARMVDDNQKPLGELQIEKIRQQLKVIHATMIARGVMPGSASSQRLFN